MTGEQANNPLHGISLENIVTKLIDHYGWDNLAKKGSGIKPQAEPYFHYFQEKMIFGDPVKQKVKKPVTKTIEIPGFERERWNTEYLYRSGAS